MQHFEDILDPRKFVRVHRSYIIQLQQMVRLEPYEKDSHVAILKSGAQVPVSRSGNIKLKQVLGY
jgi:two-component system LytT family response regulator